MAKCAESPQFDEGLSTDMENMDPCQGDWTFSSLVEIKFMLMNLMNYFGAARIPTLWMVSDSLQPDEIHP